MLVGTYTCHHWCQLVLLSYWMHMSVMKCCTRDWWWTMLSTVSALALQCYRCTSSQPGCGKELNIRVQRRHTCPDTGKYGGENFCVKIIEKINCTFQIFTHMNTDKIKNLLLTLAAIHSLTTVSLFNCILHVCAADVPLRNYDMFAITFKANQLNLLGESLRWAWKVGVKTKISVDGADYLTVYLMR